MNVDPVQPVASQAAAPASSPVPSEQMAERRDLIQAVKALNGAEFFGDNNELTFTFDRETHRPLMRLVDRNTHEVIRQVPAEYVLRMAQKLERLQK